jgi:hypothetical protein
MLRKWIYAFVAAAALAGANATPSRAAMLITGLDPTAAAPSPVEKAQLVVGVGGPGFYYGGRSYCWYDNGWRGPGWYWCGYALRVGYGWGGGAGWRGHYWRGGGYGHGGHGGRPAVIGRPHGGGRPHVGGHPHGGGRPLGGGRPHGGGGHGGGGHRRR